MKHSSIAPPMLNLPMRGIGFILVAMMVLPIQDVIIKLISGGYPVHQIVFVRSIFALFLILLLAKFEGGFQLLKTQQPLWQLGRGFLLFLAYTTYYLALAALPLGDVIALFFSSPLFVTALSIPMLGEWVGWRRWAAVVVGFVGVIIVLRPGLGIIEPAAILALFASLFYSFTVILTRHVGKTDSGTSMVFYSTLVYIACSAVIGVSIGFREFPINDHPSLQFLLRPWTTPASFDLMLIALVAGTFTIGFYCLSQAYRFAPPALIAPFEYLSLPLGILLGYLIWGDVPDIYMIVGTIFIIGSGLYVLKRAAPPKLLPKKANEMSEKSSAAKITKIPN
ncbi:MAG: DMT family transporter, partial [Chloroflexota bacterium]